MSPSLTERRRLRFTKHHGAGNDFLVLVDRKGEIDLDAAAVRGPVPPPGRGSVPTA